eukprot:gnl/TRDRNA2_/TRDRNA2_144841_c0_seq1.p1 gnl/TRDRNA2_/TRDRNA2_144841_c0~~gnl/TRDRNA2_/TRDRNA2_144841_c0_seq1.p1  ORF type:complete len:184 (+),score=31.74 gnl/TRDRNA2_/TRDRNA2_144841_c0_seq1:45-596(+)
MADNFVVLPFKEADGPAVAEIWISGLQQTLDESNGLMKLLFRQTMPTLVSKATGPEGDIGPDGANLLSHWSGDDRCLFVATSSDKVVGCCGVKRGYREGEVADTSEACSSVWRVSVAEEMRRCGVGTALMKAAEDWAREAGSHTMYLITGNPVASKFYCERMGYRRLSWTEALGPWHMKTLEA